MKCLDPQQQELLEAARTAADAAYCPYSHFPVGAAVQTEKGLFLGSNIENASYGLSICAERVALFSAIAAGARSFTRLAVCCKGATPEAPPESRMPCGACRQVMAEFLRPESEVVIDGAGVWLFSELLPIPFRLEGASL